MNDPIEIHVVLETQEVLLLAFRAILWPLALIVGAAIIARVFKDR